jgi:membrane peptidoglycan carboxypeptidase
VRKLFVLGAVIVLTAVVLAATVVALAPAARQLASAASSEPEEIDLAALDGFAVRSQIYAHDGTLLATLHGPENREPVPLSSVPQPVIDAILAVEDADFYAHDGVNFRAMARAFFENVNAGGVEQGGSTITQQLVKNALLTSERDFDRKKKEIPLALRLEQQLSKEQILEKYLNTVYFGSGAYGVQAAAETYWGVDVGVLGSAEAAMLAALIANPVSYDPTLHPEAAYEQRRLALERMVSLGKLGREDADSARTAPLPVRRCAQPDERKPLSCGDVALPEADNYFVEEVKQRLLDDPVLGDTREERIARLFDGGLRIHTTLEPSAQAEAERATAEVTPRNDKGVTAALIAVDNRTGAVRALVGGPGYDTYQYDVATLEPGRQTGSAFKTLVLLTALEQGNLPFDTIQGGGSFPCPGCEDDPYRVDGSGGTLTSVTTRSSNGAFVRLGQVVGLQNVIDLARKLGITNPTFDPKQISMSLGTKELTPLEMAGAYAAIPNGGEFVPPYFVDRIEDRQGDMVFEHETESTPVISDMNACFATQILEENVKSGTGTRARLGEQAAAGKTGTTEENYDAWFVGFTPYLTTAVWMGNPNEQVSMANLNGVANFGGTYPAMIWKAFNEPVHRGLPVVEFPECPKPLRYPQIVIGQGNPFLNGWRFGAPSAGNSQRRSGGGGGGRSTTTTAPRADEPPISVAPPVAPPTSALPTPDPGFGDGP